MNSFQLLAVPILITLGSLEARAYFRNHQPVHLLRLVVWLIGVLLILFPGFASAVANLLGIGRGTDLVLYAFMLLSTGGMFYLYGRIFLLRRDVVELSRREALRGAVEGTNVQTAAAVPLDESDTDSGGD